MAYGMQVRLSSGLTNVDDVYTVRPKEDHQIDAGAGPVSFSTNSYYTYGTFTSLGIDYNETTDAYFVVSADTFRNPNFVKRNFWDEMINNSLFAFDKIVITFVLDTSDDKAKIFFWVDTQLSTSISANGNNVLFAVDIAIVKIKAS